MLIDSHCHLNLLDFDQTNLSLAQIISNCEQENIVHLLCVAIDIDGFDEILTIANNYKQVSISAGIHPNEDISYTPTVAEKLRQQAANKKVVAIGETGLDYYRTSDDRQSQQNKFIDHIEIAKEQSKPLIIHTRMAPDDTINILTTHNARDASGVMHCFTESWDVAKKALDLGFYISLSGIVTFKNAQQVHEVAVKTPLDRLLIETDSPYLAPTPYRGKANFPMYVKYVAERIAQLKNISFNEVADQTTDNFKQLFKVSI